MQKLVVLSALLLSLPAAAAGPMCARVFDPDAYAWLETDSKEKNDWVQAQTGAVNRFLKDSPNRGAIEKFLTDYYSPENVTASAAVGKTGARIVDRGLGRGKSVDVEIETGGQKKTVLSSYDFARNNSVIPVELLLSPDGALLLVKTSTHGSLDSFTGELIDVATGKRLQTFTNMDSGQPVWVSAKELHYDEAGLKPKSYRARVLEGKIDLQLRPDATEYRASADQQWVFSDLKKDDGRRYVILQSTRDGRSLVLPPIGIQSVFSVGEKDIWIQTPGKQRFGEIVRFTYGETPDGLRVTGSARIVPEGDRVIEAPSLQRDRLLLKTYRGGSRSVKILTLDGKLEHEITAPDCCAMSGTSMDAARENVRIRLSSPARAAVRWSYNLKTKIWSVEENGGVLRPANPETEMMSQGGIDFVTTYDVYRSKDGTEIPVRVTSRKGLALNGANPVLLEGYGGFASNNYFHPEFHPFRLEFLRQGGVHVAPALRGSLFFGGPWHDAGRALNKQNVIDDFIGAAEWAIAKKLTSPNKIAISGASHGGLLVGASLTQRPDLFGLALPQFGPHDFSRKPVLDPVTTPYQKSEYGDLFDDPVAKAKAAILSPFLRAVPAKYPMTVVITGQKDSRVNPDHSFRFAAHLQDSQRGEAPILMYSLKNSGHWMSSEDRQDVIGWRATATYWTLIFDFYGMKFQPGR